MCMVLQFYPAMSRKLTKFSVMSTLRDNSNEVYMFYRIEHKFRCESQCFFKNMTKNTKQKNVMEKLGT